MSTDSGDAAVAKAAVAETKALVTEARREQQQLQFLEPLTADEIDEAKDALGPGVGMVSVFREARKRRAGRPKGVRNKRTDDFKRFIGQFGPPSAVTLKRISAMTPEELVARSQLIDPPKRQMSYSDALDRIIRCAEATLAYEESKLPVKVDLNVDGDFNLLIPGLNITQDDANRAAAGTFVPFADFEEIEDDDEIGGGGDG